jgi:ribonucleoside-diphosphate reductase alpha chain
VPECKTVGERSRRIGLGVTGLHYLLLKLGFVYGDEECVEFLERLFATFRNEAYKASIDLAQEKGSFPAFDAERFKKEEFFKTLPTRIQKSILKNGIRNAVMLTIAPCGTNSMVLGVSSGIEPIFSPVYHRRWREDNHWEETCVADALFAEYYSEGKSLDHFRGSHDITPRDHIRVQATVQQFIDSSISKTTNLPNDYPVEELGEVILEYADSVKGFTIYRSGSKGEEPLRPVDVHDAAKLADAMKMAGVQAAESTESCRGGVCEV